MINYEEIHQEIDKREKLYKESFNLIEKLYVDNHEELSKLFKDVSLGCIGGLIALSTFNPIPSGNRFKRFNFNFEIYRKCGRVFCGLRCDSYKDTELTDNLTEYPEEDTAYKQFLYNKMEYAFENAIKFLLELDR